jgi:hypothetical protein
MAETEDRSLDLLGVGKLAEAIPETAWEKLVDTACQTFTQLVAPFTGTTSGLGRLIQAKFDRWADPQKVLAAHVVSRASEKVKKRKRTGAPPKASVVLEALEASSIETDDTLRELWANLLAQEFIDGKVHPEFTRTLSRLSSMDAQVLAHIATRDKPTTSQLTRQLKDNIFVKSLAHLGIIGMSEGASFSKELLGSLNLIRRREGIWSLTATGHAFIEAVSNPSLSEEAS